MTVSSACGCQLRSGDVETLDVGPLGLHIAPFAGHSFDIYAVTNGKAKTLSS